MKTERKYSFNMLTISIGFVTKSSFDFNALIDCLLTSFGFALDSLANFDSDNLVLYSAILCILHVIKKYSNQLSTYFAEFLLTLNPYRQKYKNFSLNSTKLIKLSAFYRTKLFLIFQYSNFHSLALIILLINI
ncbi:hypothetical protein BpHYR1_040677 [Brachionus plicatilis]|uniref:Uncharacterized protein n=1 Tax=Brachionus plicatilis TaxID=10195 RepID=A0A3M7STE4_BRAPC|nr:hypothetical protein BpHYR1_040677 [Brachionus plicatilis]